jgi:hypothetical protein
MLFYNIIEISMPTEAPGTFRCKTWYPIWLNGKDNYSLYACMILSTSLVWEGRGYCSFIYRFDKKITLSSQIVHLEGFRLLNI